MKNKTLKNFMGGVSAVVLSLLSVISPLSAKVEAPVKPKRPLLTRNLNRANKELVEKRAALRKQALERSTKIKRSVRVAPSRNVKRLPAKPMISRARPSPVKRPLRPVTQVKKALLANKRATFVRKPTVAPRAIAKARVLPRTRMPSPALRVQRNASPLMKQGLVRRPTPQRSFVRTARQKLAAKAAGAPPQLEFARPTPQIDPAVMAQRQQEEARVAFLNTPFVKQAYPRYNMHDIDPVAGAFRTEDFYALDLGHQGLARSQQYSPPHAAPGAAGFEFYAHGLHLPTAPVFHPYNPLDGMNDYESPAFTLNVKLPRYKATFAPEALNRRLAALAGVANVEILNPDTFLIVQDIPRTLAQVATPERRAAGGRLIAAATPLELNSLLLRPQSWLDPNAPYSQADYARYFSVTAGAFSREGVPLLVGQTENDLLTVGTPRDGYMSTHQMNIPDVGDIVVSSAATLPLARLDLNESHELFSLVKDVTNPAVPRYAVTRHIFLSAADQTRFQQILARPGVTSAAALRGELEAERTAGRLVNIGGGRSMIDALDDVFRAS